MDTTTLSLLLMVFFHASSAATELCKSEGSCSAEAREITCKDNPKDWKDFYGYDCEHYEANKYCRQDGAYGKGWIEAWGTFPKFQDDAGIDATQACCACGGGGTEEKGAATEQEAVPTEEEGDAKEGEDAAKEEMGAPMEEAGDGPQDEGDAPTQDEGDAPTQDEGDAPTQDEGDAPQDEGDAPTQDEGDDPQDEGDGPQEEGAPMEEEGDAPQEDAVPTQDEGAPMEEEGEPMEEEGVISHDGAEMDENVVMDEGVVIDDDAGTQEVEGENEGEEIEPDADESETDDSLESPTESDAGEEEEEEEDGQWVQEWTDDNFDDGLSQRDFTIVMFYAPWCGACQQFKPAFSDAAAEMRDVSEVRFAQVDLTVNNKLARRYVVEHYPTVHVFEKDDGFAQWRDIRARKPTAVVKYMQALVRGDPVPKNRAIDEVEEDDDLVQEWNDENFDDGLDESKFTIVLFYAPWCGACKGFKPAWRGAAQEMSDTSEVRFAQVDLTVNKNLARRYKVTAYPTVHVFEQSDGFAQYRNIWPRETNEIVTYLQALVQGTPVPPKPHEGPGPRPPKKDPKTKERIYKDTEPTSSRVVTLTAAKNPPEGQYNFGKFIRENKDRVVLVKFYAEWCRHCQTLRRQYTWAAKELHKDGRSDKIVLAKVNIYQPDGSNDVFPGRFGFKSTPLMRYFRDGDPNTFYEFQLDPKHRDTDDIVSMAKKVLDGEYVVKPISKVCMKKFPGTCMYENPCTIKSWPWMSDLFRRQNWSHDVEHVTTLVVFKQLLASKPKSWVLFYDSLRCAGTTMQRAAIELVTNREESVDALPKATRKEWHIIIVDTQDPPSPHVSQHEGRLIMSTYGVELRDEGVALRVFDRSFKDKGKAMYPYNVDKAMFPVLPSLPTHPDKLHVLGHGLQKMIWCIRLGVAVVEHWDKTKGDIEAYESKFQKSMKEQYREFVAEKEAWMDEDITKFVETFNSFKAF